MKEETVSINYIDRFLSDCTVKCDVGEPTARWIVYDVYCEYVKLLNTLPLSDYDFLKDMTARGYKRTTKLRYNCLGGYIDLHLLPSIEWDSPKLSATLDGIIGM